MDLFAQLSGLKRTTFWWGFAALVAGAILAAQPVASTIIGLGFAAALVVGVTGARRRSRRLSVAERLESVLGTPFAGSPDARIAQAVALVEMRFAQIDHRLYRRHPITGLPTREPMLQQMAAEGKGVLGVIGLMDFDRLSAFDPPLGERVLLAVVERITRMLPPNLFVAHVDRANFAIWFGEDVDEGTARTEMNVIGYALGNAIVDGDREILPEIRVRQARFPADGTNAPALLARTLAALALNSEIRTVASAPAIDTAVIARERYAMEQDLRQAIARGEFQMRYQPLVDGGAGRVVGAEALIRWHHPDHGQVPPSRFVPLMEEMGLAHEIGMWTLNAATCEARRWQAQGLAALRVAVNVSGHQLQRDDMAALVQRTLVRHSLDTDALEIELTESVALGDGARAAQLFETLRAMGVRIAIDDFGTGYSGFSTLRTLAFDKIKIDREFVTDVDTRRESQAICQSIIALGRGLGIRVLAEGVERRAEYEWLRRHGCTHFQGYYFAAPLDGAAFTAFVRDTGGLATLLAIDPQSRQRQIAERLTA